MFGIPATFVLLRCKQQVEPFERGTAGSAEHAPPSAPPCSWAVCVLNDPLSQRRALSFYVLFSEDICGSGVQVERVKLLVAGAVGASWNERNLESGH